jgi:hypothetical protein
MDRPCGRTQVLLDPVLVSTRPSAATQRPRARPYPSSFREPQVLLLALKSPVMRIGPLLDEVPEAFEILCLEPPLGRDVNPHQVDGPPFNSHVTPPPVDNRKGGDSGVLR